MIKQPESSRTPEKRWCVLTPGNHLTGEAPKWTEKRLTRAEAEADCAKVKATGKRAILWGPGPPVTKLTTTSREAK